MNNPFNASNIQWASDGKSFIVSDKKQMLIGHPTILEQNIQPFNQNEGNSEEEEFEQKPPVQPEQYYPNNNINNNEEGEE